jgi:hypothetical protein
MRILTKINSRLLLILLMCCTAGNISHAQTILYVDSSSNAQSPDGSGWATSFNSLQQALDAATTGNTQIWVSKGTYYPTVAPNGCINCSTNRDKAFLLKNGVAIYGGFSGTETALAQRNIIANPTILSGDIGAIGTQTDNCYHVVVSAFNDNTAILNGFIITAGYADVSIANVAIGGQAIMQSSGGGINSTVSSPVIANCLFTGNYASMGGGMANDVQSSTVITNCIFSLNRCEGYGGGMYNHVQSSPLVTNCNFLSNNSNNSGGGMANYSDASPVITNCSFSSNSCLQMGGGMFNYADAHPAVTNCVFAFNNSTQKGGGLANFADSKPVVTNCTFFSNTAIDGGAVVYYVAPLSVMTNCIMWGNSSGVYNFANNPGEEGIITNSVVQGGYAGAGNQDTDPLFVNSSDPDGADNIFGTADDGLRLRGGSTAINGGNNINVPFGINTDIAGDPRIQNVIVDMGAYEGAFTALPLQLLSFSAQQINKDVLLKWKTSNEINTAYFNVERSIDAKTFTSIGIVKSVNATGTWDYKFKDVEGEVLNKTLYYRLKQVDIDGRFTHSPVATVSFTNTVIAASLHPNPVMGQVTLTVTLQKPEQIQVHFIDNAGKVVRQSGYQLTEGTTLLPLNLSSLTPGVYYAEIKGTSFSRQIKFIKL